MAKDPDERHDAPFAAHPFFQRLSTRLAVLFGILAATAAVIGNYDKLVDFYNSSLGIGAADLSIADPKATPHIPFPPNNHSFDLALTVKKKYGTKVRDCVLRKADFDAYFIELLEFKFDIPANVSSLRQVIRVETTSGAREMPPYPLTESVYLECAGAVSNIISFTAEWFDRRQE